MSTGRSIPLSGLALVMRGVPSYPSMARRIGVLLDEVSLLLDGGVDGLQRLVAAYWAGEAVDPALLAQARAEWSQVRNSVSDITLHQHC